MTIGRTRHRTLFLSDFHLGSHNCKAKRLYEFLWRNDAERIYLVGDIIEGGILRRWPAFHDDVLRILAEKAHDGAEIVFVPGNHDSLFRHHVGRYANLRIATQACHETAKGNRILVIHGDETDLFRLDTLLWLITKFEAITGLHLWEIVRRLCGRLIEQHTIAFENKIMAIAHDQGYCGVLCGHIHMPRITDRGALYLNPGDWTWHCTAIVEDFDGNLRLLQG